MKNEKKERKKKFVFATITPVIGKKCPTAEIVRRSFEESSDQQIRFYSCFVPNPNYLRTLQENMECFFKGSNLEAFTVAYLRYT